MNTSSDPVGALPVVWTLLLWSRIRWGIDDAQDGRGPFAAQTKRIGCCGFVISNQDDDFIFDIQVIGDLGPFAGHLKEHDLAGEFGLIVKAIQADGLVKTDRKIIWAGEFRLSRIDAHSAHGEHLEVGTCIPHRFESELGKFA